MPAKKSTHGDQSSTSKTLFFIRHGQSIANRDYDESSAYRDAGLSSQGIAQARGLRGKLEQLEPDLVVVSPLTRALQTCENALPPSYSGPVIVLPEITEVCSSHYSCGQARSLIEPMFPKTFDWSNVPTDRAWWWEFDKKRCTESGEFQAARVEKFRQFIKSRSERRIAVFSHGDFIWEFLEGKQSYLANCQVVPYNM